MKQNKTLLRCPFLWPLPVYYEIMQAGMGSVSDLQGVDCVLNDLNPAVSLLFRAGVHFYHLWIFYPHAD